MRSELHAESLGARDYFLRIGNICRGDLVHHFGGGVAKHALGANVEDLDDTLGVRRNAGEVRAAEDRALECSSLEQRFLCLLAGGIVGSNQQIADDRVLRITERGDGHDSREAAPILADVGQLIDVLDATRGLEHQRLETGRDRGSELDAEGFCPNDHFLRIGDVGRRDLVHHFRGRVSQHPFGADVEDLDDALGVGGYAREVGAAEDRALQRSRLQQGFFGLLAGGVVGADQQVADDRVLRVAERRNRHDCREPASILSDVGQLIDVFDPARSLEDQRLESRGDRCSELDAQCLRARDHFLRIGNVGRSDLVHHVGRGIAQHPLGADVEDLDDAFCVCRDAGEVGAAEDRALQRSSLEQRFFGLLAGGVVGSDQQVADDRVLSIAQRGDGHNGRETTSVLADVRQLVDVFDSARRLEHQRLEPGRDRCSQLDAEGFGANDDFLRIGDIGRRDLVHHLFGFIAEHPLGADVEDLDDAFGVGGDAGEVGAVENRALQRARRDQGLCVSGGHASQWDAQECGGRSPACCCGGHIVFLRVSDGRRGSAPWCRALDFRRGCRATRRAAGARAAR